MPSTYNATTTWRVMRITRDQRTLSHAVQHPADRLRCAVAMSPSHDEGKQLGADFIIIMIYYYDPSPTEHLVKPP